MNHPTPEEWMSYLYGELSAEQRRALDAHAAGCRECEERLANWRDAMGHLDRWPLPVEKAAPPVWHFARWAAAVAVLMGLGFGLAKFTMPAPDLSAMESRLREQLRSEFAQLAERQAARDTKYQDAIVKVLGGLEAERRADLARLRRDVETVAVLAEDGISTTQDQLVRLANFTPQK